MVAGVSSLPPSKSTTEYDERGRVFRTHVYSIDPGGAGVGRDLTTDHWYDGRGLTIKTAAPGAAVRVWRERVARWRATGVSVASLSRRIRRAGPRRP